MSSLSDHSRYFYNQEQRNFLKQLIQIKPMESYPFDIKKELMIISLKPSEMATPFGSAIYRMQPYGADIDALQHIHYNTEYETIQQFIRALRHIVLTLDRNHVYSEFKCGLDWNYVIIVGKFENGIFTPDKELVNILKDRHQRSLLSDKEYATMMNALKLVEDNKDDTNINSMAYDYIFDLLRNKMVLRWSKKDILKGWIATTYNPRYLLAEALNDETIVKIDLISLVNGKFVEVTNILFLAYPETAGNGEVEYIPINVSEEKLHSRGLSPDIEKLYCSNKFYSPFKACKRIYAEMRRIHNYEYLTKLAPIIRHDISRLYQLKSQIETFLIILSRSKAKYYINLINHQLQEIKGQLTYVLDLSQEEIIKFSKEIDDIYLTGNLLLKYEKIDKLIKAFKSIIQYLTITAMNKQTLNPIPSIFLPSPRKYDPNLVRKSTDDPTEDYKNFVKLLNG